MGGFVFTGGIAAEDPETGKMVEGDVRDQARRCMETMKAILEAAGSSLDKVVKVTVLFANFDDKARFEEVYGGVLPGRQAGADVGGGELSRAEHPDGDRRDRPTSEQAPPAGRPRPSPPGGPRNLPDDGADP